MRRAQLLKLVDIPATTYNSLNNRGHLPFDEHLPSRGWTTFNEEHAVRLSLLMDLARAGMSQLNAAALVRQHFDDLLDLANERTVGDGSRFLFGGVALETAGEDRIGSQVIRPVVAVYGTLDDALSAAVDGHVSHSDIHALAIVLVDVTATISTLYRRFRRSDMADLEMGQWAILFGSEKGRLRPDRGTQR